MADLVSEEVQKNTATLKDMIDQLCSSKEIYQGDGPPIAMFRTPPDPTDGTSKIFVYVSFSNNGEKPEGKRVKGVETFGDVLKTSIAAFDAWLQPRRTLVWRVRPEVSREPGIGLWYVYWRCVQLDDGARSLPVDWHF